MKKYAVEKWVFFSTATMSAIIIRKEWKGPYENISRKTNPFRKTERGNSLYELYYCFFISA